MPIPSNISMNGHRAHPDTIRPQIPSFILQELLSVSDKLATLTVNLNRNIQSINELREKVFVLIHNINLNPSRETPQLVNVYRGRSISPVRFINNIHIARSPSPQNSPPPPLARHTPSHNRVPTPTFPRRAIER